MACVKCSQGDHADHVEVYQGTECIGCGCTSVKKGGAMDKTLRINLEGGIDALKRKIDSLEADRASLMEALRDILNDQHSDCRKSLADKAQTLLAQVEGKGK